MRRRALVVAAALLAAACPDGGAQKAGLRVPLPPGWVAVEGQGGALRAGPKGRVVLTLAHQGDGALPPPEQLERALEAEGAALLSVQRTADTVLVRYRLEHQGQAATAFAGARRLDGRLFLCASEPGADESELRVAEGVCGELRWGASGAAR